MRENPIFSWSISRRKMLEECELDYLLWYYVSHNGWLKGAPPLTEAAYRQKKAIPLKEFNHYLLTKEFQNELIDLNQGKGNLFSRKVRISATLNNAVSNSVKEKHKDKWYRKPSQHLMISELQFSNTLDGKTVNEAKKRTNEAFKGFSETLTYNEVKEGKKVLFIPGANDYPSVKHPVDDYRIYLQVNSVIGDEKGKVIGSLFKTDGEPSTIEEIGVFSIYLKEKFPEAKEYVIRDDFLLPKKEIILPKHWKDIIQSEGENYIEYLISPKITDLMLQTIDESVKYMEEFVIGGNLETNQMKPMDEMDYKKNKEHLEDDSEAYCNRVKRDLERYPLGFDGVLKIMED